MDARLLLAAALASALAAAPAVRPTLPGLQPDGTTLLHNQWPISPVGRQSPLGDFPVNAAVDPSGRWVAVLHAGHGRHEVRVIEMATGRAVGGAPLHEAFCGLAFSADGSRLYCSGGSDGVLHVFAFEKGRLVPEGDLRVESPGSGGVVAGFALAANGAAAAVALTFDSRVVRVDTASGRIAWTARLEPGDAARPAASADASAPNDVAGDNRMRFDADPLNVVWDEPAGRLYVSLWGESAVAVLDAGSGRLLARWATGLHPNEMALSRDGRLFVSNGGQNSVTVLDTATGQATEQLSSALAPGEPPGSTPDSLALGGDGTRLFVANAYTNTVAVFDVGERARGRPLGFIPTGWFPTSVRLTPDASRLAVVSGRGLGPRPSGGKGEPFRGIAELYPGSLAVVDLPRGAAFGRALSAWTVAAQRCRPAPPSAPGPGDPIPAADGRPGPIRYVIYVIKENRTYDQVLGDMPEGSGEPSLCLFPERITPNLHAIARQFVLLDNFYANAEVSAGGHEWSTAGYSSEFVEKSWPVNYGHGAAGTRVPYPAEGHFSAALPQLGYLWDRAAAASVTYRSYGEFAENPDHPGGAVWTNLPALRGHLDPNYPAWDLRVRDRDRAREFIAQLRAFEAQGDMPRLQIVRLPEDHTAGARLGDFTPRAMVADNDLAVGRLLEAVSTSRFWPQTAVFVVEDDAQSGPDHVDAHRTVALVAGPHVRRGAVDSTPYTTCSMLRTIELILGLEPMSQFDAAAQPMRASFQPTADTAPFRALSPQVDLEERNVAAGEAARLSAGFDLSREDLVDDRVFNRVIWETMRGAGQPVPAPVHAAFVRVLPQDDD